MSCRVYLENHPESRRAPRRAQHALYVFFFILVCCVGKDAAGQTTAPVVSLNATTINPGYFPVGTTSQAEYLWVTNSGNASLTITSIALTGADPNDFAQTNDCGSSLAAGAKCLVLVTFTPTAVGTRTAYLDITDNATGSPQTVNLSGTGTGPVTSFLPSSLTFASQAVGSTSAVQTITLENIGIMSTSILNISSIALTGANPSDFSQTNNCASSEAIGAKCKISVTFSPTEGGSRTAAITLTDNTTTSPQTLSLTGTGLAPAASLSTSGLSFGNQPVNTTSTAQTVTLTNSGNLPLSLSGLSVSGTNAGDFVQSSNCISSLAAGANCAISVIFTPSAIGSRAASLTITDNASGSPQSVSFSGTGTAAVASLSPTVLSFGSQLLSTTSPAQTIILTNSGNVPLSVTSLAVSGATAADFAQSNNCGSSVAAGANCTISATFTPAATGNRAASLTITDNAIGSPQAVSLAGNGTAPVAGLSPTNLSFGNQSLSATSAAQTISLTNSGTANLSISGITFSGTNPGDFAQSNNCGGSVGPSANCTLSVAFTPSVLGSETASMIITDNAVGGPQAVSLSGTGTAPEASLSPTALSFGNQLLSTASAAQSIRLTNSGNVPLSVTSLSVAGANASDFAQSNSCGSSVAAGANCTISVIFTPAAPGNRAASLTITDNASGSPQAVSLSGTGTAPVASLSPINLSFGNQFDGTTSAAQTIALTNTGTATLSITSLVFTGVNPGDFAQSNNCGSNVAVGANCTINITFTPAANGNRAASLTITDNAIGSPQAVSLSGTGTAPVASLSPINLSFGNQFDGTTSAAQTIALTNTGTATLSITSLVFTGVNPGDFAQSNNCGGSVGPSANCTISVTFAPAAPGNRAASLTITDNASGSPQAVSLSGNGTAPVASLSPANLSFGCQFDGTTSAGQPIALTNTGTATLSITSLAFTGVNPGDFAQSNNCGSSVAVGANCTISVTFTPAASGSRAASLTIIDNAAGSPQTVSFTGTGTAPVASLSISSLAFASEPVDMISSPQDVTLNNTGNAALKITSIAFSGADATDFTENDTCIPSVGAGGSCSIAIVFTPLASGTRAASLTITDNASGSQQSVALAGTGAHDVILAWSASTTAGVMGYYVYRGTISGRECATPLNSMPLNGTTYADENVTAGATYYYLVTAVASDDITQSSASTEVSATLPSP